MAKKDERELGIELLHLSRSAFILVVSLLSKPVHGQGTSTSGDCSPIIDSVSGDVTINCGGSQAPDIPVFSGYISMHSNSHESAELLEFLEKHNFQTVFIRLYIDTRFQIPFDYISDEVAFCNRPNPDIFSSDGMQLPIVNAQDYDKYYIGFDIDWDRWSALSDDEKSAALYEKIEGSGEMCSHTALSIQTDRAKWWDDNGWEVASFLLVDNTCGHMTSPLITLEQHSRTAAEWLAASEALPAADEARDTRYAQWEETLSQ